MGRKKSETPKNHGFKTNDYDRICVYEHYYGDEKLPFYVGQGRIGRAFSFSSVRNKSWREKVEDESMVKVKIVALDITIEKSIEIEKELISKYGRIDIGTGCLTNENNGGKNSQSGCDNYFYNVHMNNEENPNFGNKYEKNPLSKPIVQLNILGELVREWASAREADEIGGFHSTSINKCCLGQRNIAEGYLWKFKCDYNPDDDNRYIPGATNSRIYIGIPQDKDPNKSIYVFYGTGESKKFGFIPDKVSAVARGKRNVHKGYIFYDFFKLNDDDKKKYIKYVDITKI